MHILCARARFESGGARNPMGAGRDTPLSFLGIPRGANRDAIILFGTPRIGRNAIIFWVEEYRGAGREIAFSFLGMLRGARRDTSFLFRTYPGARGETQVFLGIPRGVGRGTICCPLGIPRGGGARRFFFQE